MTEKIRISGVDIDQTNPLSVKVTSTSLEPIYTELSSPINSSINSINVNRQTRGGAFIALPASTTSATSAEFDCVGYNALDIRVIVTGTATFAVKIQGCLISGGTFVDRYDVGLFNSTRSITIPQVPDYFKIVVIRQSGTGTCQVDVVPCIVHGSIQKPSYKEYTLAWNVVSVAQGADSTTFNTYNTEWVRGIHIAVSSNFDYIPFYQSLYSTGDATNITTICSTRIKNASGGNQNFRATNMLIDPSSMSPYGIRFGVRNSDSSISGVFSAHIIMIGG